jgi:predicted nucleotidyltransferase
MAEKSPVKLGGPAEEFRQKCLPLIESEYSPDLVILFGSAARKETEANDIDIIIVSKAFEGTKFIRRMGDVVRKFDFSRHIDALCYTPSEFEQVKENSTVVEQALKEGIVLSRN